ncbi:MAG TPA: branched-chain amino acid ABC transporter ATP-binding protein/permease, partial [Caldimonas sp.]|nr:branched-chain amino acid ABC transporter ATP-binding protein/permease [Caldimonas sp.]
GGARVSIGRSRAALVAGLVLMLAAPLVIGATYFKFILILVYVYAIVAIGLNVLAGYAGQFSLGHAGLMAIGAYVSALLSKGLAPYPAIASWGGGVWIGMLAGTLAAGVFGALLAIPALRLKGPYLAMVTVAFGWMVWKLLVAWVSVTGGELGITAIPRPRVTGVAFQIDHYYYLAAVAVTVACALQRNLIRSDVGRKLRALKHSEIAAASVGIDVHREKVVVFVISALFAGFGGALFAHLQNFINPDNFQFFNSVFFVLAILFGGAGTLAGPVFGAAFLTILPELLHDAERFRLIIYALIILVTLFFLPNGLAGLLPKRWSAIGAAPPARSLDRASMSSDRAAPDAAARGERATPGHLIAAEHLGKSFGGVRALADVDIAVAAGSIHAVIGPNGAGKTTLINIFSGYYAPDAGRIEIDGAPADLDGLHAAARRGIVRTFQTIKLFGDMTVREHVMIGCEIGADLNVLDTLLRNARQRREEHRRRAIADALLARVGLCDLADAPADTLPYGHRRLLEIARALAARPRLLLLDEPAAGLVASEIARLAQLIESLRREGLGILLVEHHMDLVMRVSDTVTVLDYGEVIARGTPAQVRADPRVVEAYLGVAAGEEPAYAAR